MTASPCRRIALTIAMLAAAFAVGLPCAASGASAASAGRTVVAVPPTPRPGTGTPGEEGATPTLKTVLEAAARGYLDARLALANSRKRQRQLEVSVGEVQRRLDDVTKEVGVVAGVAYRLGRLGVATAMLNSSSPDNFLERAEAAEVLAQRDDAVLRKLTSAHREYAAAKAAVDREVATQTRQAAIMKKRQDDAIKALAAVGGQATGGFVSATSPLAVPAPSRSDGSWPSEKCIIDDPTTSGCVTPRLLHAYKQSRAAGFQRFTRCFRTGGPYEHPKGRACDFAAEKTTFGGHASGASRRYGNDLAAFLVRNADRLGVLYVIWYRQIWFPGRGWSSYGGGGDPASAHTNHVHLSVY